MKMRARDYVNAMHELADGICNFYNIHIESEFDYTYDAILEDLYRYELRDYCETLETYFNDMSLTHEDRMEAAVLLDAMIDIPELEIDDRSVYYFESKSGKFIEAMYLNTDASCGCEIVYGVFTVNDLLSFYAVHKLDGNAFDVFFNDVCCEYIPVNDEASFVETLEDIETESYDREIYCTNLADEEMTYMLNFAFENAD